jgi:hypothetical protein
MTSNIKINIMQLEEVQDFGLQMGNEKIQHIIIAKESDKTLIRCYGDYEDLGFMAYRGLVEHEELIPIFIYAALAAKANKMGVSEEEFKKQFKAVDNLWNPTLN